MNGRLVPLLLIVTEACRSHGAAPFTATRGRRHRAVQVSSSSTAIPLSPVLGGVLLSPRAS